MELPRRSEQRDHSYRRYRCALLSDVCVNLRLGEHRSPKVRSVATLLYEDDLSTPLFLNVNHNLAYCYNDARVIKWLWSNVIKNKFQGGVRSFED